MDFLNKAWTQLAELFRSMTPGARITSVLLLAVVVASLGYLFRYQASGPGVYLLGGEHFSPSDMDAMIAAFSKANLDSYEIEGTRIRVPRAQQAKYVAALADNNALPKEYFTATDQADKGGNIFESDKQREQRLKVAKQKELSLIVSRMQGIENAVVLYDTEVKSGLNKEKITRAVASVKPRGSETLKDNQVLAIRRLVAGAFADVAPERVTVCDLNSGETYFGSTEGGLGNAIDDPYISRKRVHEQLWVGKILNALSYIPGVNVTANVELDKSQETRLEEVKHETKSVPYRVSEKTSTRTVDGGVPAGRPGPLAQAANAPTSLTNQRVKGSHEEEEQSQQDTVNAIPGSRKETKTAGLTPQRVTVTVGIPASYFKKVWLERNPTEAGAQPKTPDPKDLDTIRAEVLASTTKQVANLLPKPEGVSDPSELVAVSAVQDITPPSLPEPSTKELAMSWFAQQWSMLGLLLLAFVSLLVLRSVARAAPAVEPAPGIPMAAGPEPEAEEAKTAEAEPTSRLKRFRKPGTSLRDELSELVTEDPDAAANVLRAWIGNAT